MEGLPVIFQREQAKGMSATYHFTFTGAEPRKVTIAIHDRRLEVTDGHQGAPDLRVTADSTTWVRFLNGQASLVWALLTLRIKLRGSPQLLLAFSRCFPS
nr:SCP2 sterol-binding domain-containing protein [Mycolicibacterium sp. lyk4-40-TYG-92]